MLCILICAVNLTVCYYCVTYAFQSESTLNKSRPFWLNGLVFVYELRLCGFQSRYCHLNFRYRAYFELGVSQHSGNYRVYIHSEMRMRGATSKGKSMQKLNKHFKMIQCIRE